MLITEKKLRTVIRKIIKENHPWENIINYHSELNKIEEYSKIFYEKYCSITWPDHSKDEWVFSFKPNFNKTYDGDVFIQFFDENITKIVTKVGRRNYNLNNLSDGRNFKTVAYENFGIEGIHWMTSTVNSKNRANARGVMATMEDCYIDIIEKTIKKYAKEFGCDVDDIDESISHN